MTIPVANRMARPDYQPVELRTREDDLLDAIAREFERRRLRQSLVKVALLDPNFDAMALRVATEIAKLASHGNPRNVLLLHRHPGYTHALHRLRDRGLIHFTIAPRLPDGRKQWKVDVRSAWLDAASRA